MSLGLLWPGAALAEVSDKLPSSTAMVLLGAAGAVICFAGARRQWWLGLLLGLLHAALLASLWVEVHADDLYPHLLREQGAQYFVLLYGAGALVLVGLVAGWLSRRR